MVSFRSARVAALAALAIVGAASCSDSNDDDLGTACRSIVEDCHVGTSVGDCIDEIGDMPADCISCIASQGCGYATCQRSSAGCRIPTDLLKR